MLSAGFFPVITIPAKINEGNPITPYSLIDQVWVNFKTGTEHDSGVVVFPLTDHFPIYYMFKSDCLGALKVIESRLINDNTMLNFITAMSNSNFNPVYNTDNLNTAFECFWRELWKVYSSSFPIKRKKVKSNLINAPWVTPDLKKCIKKKYRLFNLLRRGLIQRRQFNMYKNALTWVINKIRRKYYHEKFENDMKDTRKTWSNVNQLLGRGRKEPVRRIITDEGRIVEGPSLANHFNNYFTSVVSRIMESLPRDVNFNYLSTLVSVPHSCFFMPTNEREVLGMLKTMPNKGNSLNDIKPNVLLLVSNIICPILAYLYNLSILEGVYPCSLKIGRITPVFKSGDVSKVGNYRPISNLLTINKVFELLTFNRMMKFVDRYDILSNLQYGFRKAKSTTQAIFKLVSDLLNTFNKKYYTIALFLDLSKAFDTINREILIHKLSANGFRGVANSYLSSYMTNRKQYVTIGNHESETKLIENGVPQGSVLGPLLFNIVRVGRASKVLFADDAVFYITESSLDLCVARMSQLIGELSEWLVNNKLVANVNKTKLMMFTPRPVDLPDIDFNGTVLEWVSSIRYLGIVIDDKLNFSLQASEVYKKVCKMHGVFYSLSSLMPQKTLVTVYHSLVYPIITQNIIIWGGISATNLNSIKIMLNNIMRCILNVKYDDNNIPMMSVNNMYKSLNLIKFDDIYRYFILKFLHYVFYKNLELFNKYYVPLLPMHTYETRNTKINLPMVRLEIEKHFTIFQSCKLLNELPNYLMEPQSDFSLKEKFRRYVIADY